MQKQRIRINDQIRVAEMRVIGPKGENFGVLTREQALAHAKGCGLDLIEISPKANPPVVKMMDYGKFCYDEKKKARNTRQKTRTAETKVIQVKIGTGEHDKALKSKRVSEWLLEGNRVKVDLFLPGRTKYMEKNFLEERLNRFLRLIPSEYKIADPIKKNPKGLTVTIEPQRRKRE